MDLILTIGSLVSAMNFLGVGVATMWRWYHRGRVHEGVLYALQ